MRKDPSYPSGDRDQVRQRVGERFGLTAKAFATARPPRRGPESIASPLFRCVPAQLLAAPPYAIHHDEPYRAAQRINPRVDRVDSRLAPTDTVSISLGAVLRRGLD